MNVDNLEFKVVWQVNLCEETWEPVSNFKDKECIIFQYFIAEIERLTIINRNLKKQLNNIDQSKGR